MGGDDQVSALAAISSRDPAFDVHAFLSQAAHTYLEVQRARASGHADTVADLVGGAARSQLGLNSPGHPVAGPEPKLGELSVVQAATDAAWDSIVVRIPARVGDATETEDWTFQRPATATTTNPSKGVTCSSCGAPRQATPAGTCRFCSAPLSPPNGWTVTLVASVTDPAPASGQNATDLAAALATVLQAANTARQNAAGKQGPQASAPSKASKASGCGCLLIVLLIFGIPTAILAFAAATPSSGLHKTLSFLPFLKRGYLDGQTQLAGAITTSGVTGNFVPGVNQCAKVYLKDKQLNFTGTLADGSTLRVKADALSGGPLGTIHYTNNSEIEITPSVVTKSGVAQQWAATNTSMTSFVLSGTGSGQLMVTGYAPSLSGPGTPQGPLTLTINWTCRNR